MLVVISIIALFSLLVILHEWGHFIAARRGGVDVDEFGVGFPPRMWGKQIGRTLYSINWLPLGGFVRLKGEDSAESGPHTFGGAKYSVKFKILMAGVAMNLLTAVVILYGLCLTGMPGIGDRLMPGFLESRYSQPKTLLLTQVGEGSPAARAGLERGDFLLRGNATKLETDEDLRNFTKANAGKTVTLHVRSDGDEREVKVKLRPAGTTEGFLGVSSMQFYKLQYDPLRAAVAALYITGAIFVATIVGVLQLFASIPTLILGLFGSTVPVEAQAASGPVGIVFIMMELTSVGFAYVWLFTANIAIALAAFNALPLPALDGGRLALISIQKFFKRKINPETEAKIHAIGFMALIALMVVITVYDIRKHT